MAFDLETGKLGTGWARYVPTKTVRNQERDKMEIDMEEILKKLRERCKRTVLRKLDSGEVVFDKVKKIFMIKDTDEEYKVEQRDDGEDSDESDEDKPKIVKKKGNKDDSESDK